MSLLNEATERLLDAGDWDGLLFRIHVCARNGCVVFPKWVGEVRALNICRRNIPVHNIWWSFIPENMQQVCNSWFDNRQQISLIGNGDSPVFSDIYGDGRLVRAYPRIRADIGKTVTVFGVDGNGQVLRTLNPDGSMSDGVVITINLPFGSTSTYVRHIDRLTIDELQGPLNLFAYNVTADVLEPIGQYEPGDTDPSFARYTLRGPCVSCDKELPLIALIKVKYVPVRLDTDLVLIPKLSALKDMMQSVKFSEAGDTQSAAAFEAKAIRGLNLALWNRDGENIPVSLGEFGNTSVGRQQTF